jgi:hypothetical protein
MAHPVMMCDLRGGQLPDERDDGPLSGMTDRSPLSGMTDRSPLSGAVASGKQRGRLFQCGT